MPIFLRLFTILAVCGAFAALGYAYWLSFEPVDAAPRSGMVPSTTKQRPAEAPSAMDGTNTREAPTRPVAPAKPALALDKLRQPIRDARAAVDEVRTLGREAHQAGVEIAEALPDAEDLTAGNAWRYVRQARDGVVRSLEQPEAPTGYGRVHASGAPPYRGGGQPGAAQQPGMDWYKAGGKAARD